MNTFKLVRFNRNVGAKGFMKFVAGQYYLLDPQCQSHVDGGSAELVDEAAPAHYLPALEARSRIATACAEAAAVNARALQQDAAYAQRAFDVRVAFESLPPAWKV